MPDDTHAMNRLKAVGIVNVSSARLSPETQTQLVDAIELDLNAASEQLADDSVRIAKLEGQVHALSDAIIVIAQPSDEVDRAARAVKEKM